MKTFIAFGAAAVAAVSVHAQVTGLVTLKGTPPPEKPMATLIADAKCGKLVTGTPMTRGYVVGANSGLANVIVYVKNPPADSKGKAPATPSVIDQKGCLYEPYVIGAVAGQPVEVRTSDPELHNIWFQKSVATPPNTPFNEAMPAGSKPKMKTFANPELFAKMVCSVHPWMTGYIAVVDSPFFSVTDKDGKFSIPGLPDGKYTLGFKHVKAGETVAEIEVKGGKAESAATLEVAAPK